MAVRLCAKDIDDKDTSIFLVSAYAPVSTASEEAWNDYYEKLQACIDRRKQQDILMIGSDCNASIGINPTNEESVVGQYGLKHTNHSGRRLKNFLAVNNLCSTSTYFKKKNYGTWAHPRSKNLHQLDHIFVNRSSLKSVTNAGITTPMLYSDHRAVRCNLRLQIKLKKRSDPRSKIAQLDFAKLKSDPAIAANFRGLVKDKVTVPNNSCLSLGIKEAATEVLPRKEKPQPGWFQLYADTLNPLIDARNKAMAEVYSAPRRTRSSTLKLRATRKKLSKAIQRAKSEWLKQQFAPLNEGFINARGTKPAWDAISKLKSGMTKTKPSTVQSMKKPDGSPCKTPEENAEVFRNHFSKLFNHQAMYDETVLELLDQLPSVMGLDHAPTDEEIKEAVNHLRNSGPGESGICAPAYKCLLESEDTYQILKEIIVNFWETEEVPEDWENCLLKILPKKGDLSEAGNHRGIMLLEIAYKIAANILKKRMIPIEESLDHETQCGFRPGRGCTDAVFTVKSALRKRREHGLETWVIFLDLVKAFDRVPRAMLWMVLRKFGVPEKIVSLLIRLHENVNVKFEVQGVTSNIKSNIGVKQGDILGPVLFNFYIAAIMITWRKVFQGPTCTFRSKEDFEMTGRSYRAYGEEFPLTDSEYADDTAAMFVSRVSLEEGAPLLLNHFSRFGMEVHKGTYADEKKKSKTEVLFCSKPLHMYDDAATYDGAIFSHVDLGGGFYLPIVFSFVYLGCTISSDGTDTLDIRNRIDKAGGAFGTLRDCFFKSTNVSQEAKAFIYCCLILAVLLYGAESWCLTESLWRELSCFHHQCIRAMCRLNRKHAREHRISSDDLMNRLNIKPIHSYVTKRQLRWAGHVSRMDFGRLPRKMISSWVRSKRPRGAPKMTYGRTLKRSLHRAGINPEQWVELAADRDTWRELLNNL